MSVSDIAEQIKAVYNFEISTASISRITEKIVEDIHAWQNRPLERLYMVVWMDGIVFRVREDHRVIDKTMYIAIGLRQDGIKEVLGIWLGKNESASFWLAVLTDIKSRGVEDILITATDNLKGFVEAIAAVFPQTTKQICVVHQIRNSCKYVPWKERKAFIADLRTIYEAKDREAAEMALELVDQKWGGKYSIAIKSWRNNWETLTPFLEYPLEMRKIIYTTNTIENLNGKIRKYTKNKLSFPTDEALKKAVYLAVMEASKKWTQPIQNWGLILQQFVIMFESRIKP
jgi:transposase-like protein